MSIVFVFAAPWTSLGQRQDLDRFVRLDRFTSFPVCETAVGATVVLSSQHQAGRRRNCCVHKRSQTGIGEGSTAACPTHNGSG